MHRYCLPGSDLGSDPGQELKDRGDRKAHELIVTRIREEFPDDPILSEETKVGDDVGTHRTQSDRVWIVDPLDGTREFAEPGRSDWAVHIALSVGGAPVFGVVALPAQGILLRSDHLGALPIMAEGDRSGADSASGPKRQTTGYQVATEPNSGVPGVASQNGDRRLRMAVSRSRPDPKVLKVAEILGAELVPWGSAGAKSAKVLLGDCDAYAHDGGQYEWDSAAPVAVALGWGYWASRLDGREISYNNADPYMPDLLVCRQDLAPVILEAVSAAGA